MQRTSGKAANAPRKNQGHRNGYIELDLCIGDDSLNPPPMNDDLIDENDLIHLQSDGEQECAAELGICGGPDPTSYTYRDICPHCRSTLEPS